MRASLALLLKQAGYRALAAAAPAEALEWLASHPVQLVLQDMNFTRRTTGEEGLALLREIRARRPALPVILMTAWGSIALAVEGMKAGASDFVTKPWTNPQLLQTDDTALGLAARPQRRRARCPAREELDAAFDFGDLVGEDPRLLRILQLVGRVAAHRRLGADHRRERHRQGADRRGHPPQQPPQGAAPSSRSTSAASRRPCSRARCSGTCGAPSPTPARTARAASRLAHGGTIFLDEIGELDPAAQVKLLRVLQDRTFEVLGSSTRRTVDVRVVSATNRNLAELVTRAQFREDLLYRLNLIAMHLPPLRERSGDIPCLAGRFLQALGPGAPPRRPVVQPGRAGRAAERMPWPGNVRQLRQGIERAVLMSPADVLQVADLASPAAGEGVGGAGRAADNLPAVGSMTMDEIERAMILKSLAHHGGTLSRAAESLGLSRAALYRRLERYGIRP